MIGVNVEVSSGVYETVKTYSKIIYEKPLNGNGFFDIVIAGSDIDYFATFSNGKTVQIYKNGSIDFYGVIEKTSNTSQGFLRIEGVELGAKLFSQAMASKNEYLNPNVTAVVADLLSNVSGITSGTITSKTVPSFRTEVNQSCLAALNKLAKLSDQDWYFSYSGATVYVNLVTHAGSVSSVGILNGGSDLGMVTKETDDTKKVKKVTVIGAGIGSSDQEITGLWGYASGGSPVGGDNTASGITPGDGSAEKTIIDKSIISKDEAEERADHEYNILRLSRYVYNFKVLDADRTYDVGDVVTLVDGITDTNADVRITNIKRIVTTTTEKLDLEVRGTGERSRSEDILSSLNLLSASKNDADTMKQGADLDGCACITGDVDCCNLNVCPGICTCNMNVCPVVSICYAGAITCQGYFYGGFSQAFGYGAWCNVSNTVNVPANSNSQCKYLGHGVWINMIEGVCHDGDSSSFVNKQVAVRIYNTTNGIYFPSSSGIVLNRFLSFASNRHEHCQNIPVHSHEVCITCIYYDHRHYDDHCHYYLNLSVGSYTGNRCPSTCTGLTTDSGYLCNCDLRCACSCSVLTCTANNCTCYVGGGYSWNSQYSTFLWLPFDWYNTNYRIQYCVNYNTKCWCNCMNYSYYGILGHEHNNATNNCVLNHNHGSANCVLDHTHCAELSGNVCYCVCYFC